MVTGRSWILVKNLMDSENNCGWRRGMGRERWLLSDELGEKLNEDRCSGVMVMVVMDGVMVEERKEEGVTANDVVLESLPHRLIALHLIFWVSGMDTLPYRKTKAKGVMWENSGDALVAKNSNEYGSISERFQHDSSKRGSYDLRRTSASPSTFNVNSPFMMPLLSISSVEDYISKTSTVLTGTAKNGSTGPSVGALDIGVNESAYFFRVALPGVKRDPGHFSCEIECDGKVLIRGVTTTGERTVFRHGRVFEMKVQQQCPPGPFTLYFSLPGPVDPRLFFPNFRSDGILEAVVVKLHATDAFKSASLNI
ncbi:increased DNA methylation 3-like [Heracleum sosnowskyi]|uniref:Increased DNA methylation 3-like n=1 Tax=Heracleum sosnowskyi TaxID=360622 RepID=A0AAD8IMS3_9APIA|nr:increased DNA methylation 3-like [Heracleum sosnowskyi]